MSINQLKNVLAFINIGKFKENGVKPDDLSFPTLSFFFIRITFFVTIIQSIITIIITTVVVLLLSLQFFML